MAVKTKTLNKRKLQALAAKKRIFEASARLFAEKGFEKVRIKDICDEIGISVGAFYCHYPSKDRIIVDQYRKIDEYNATEMLDIISRQKTYRDKLQAWSRMNLSFMLGLGKPAIKVTYASQIGLTKKHSFLINNKRPIYTVVEKILTEGQKAGEFRTDVPGEVLIQTINRAFRGLLFEWCLAGSKFDLEAAWKDMNMILSKGIYTDRS